MNLTKLAYFVKIAETGSISRAAMALGIAQSALSRFLGALEAELDCPLFERNGRGVSLSDAGRRFYAHAKDILDQVEAAELEVAAPSGPPLGTVTLGIAPMLSAILGPRIAARLHALHPRILLRISEDHSSAVFHPSESGLADVVIGFRESLNWPADATTLMRDEVHYVVRRDKWRGPRTFDMAQAAGIPLVAASHSDPIRAKFEAAVRAKGMAPKVISETESLVACVELVGAGFCAALAPGLAVGAFPKSTIALRLDALDLSCEIVVATPLAKPLTRLARLLRDLIVEELGDESARRGRARAVRSRRGADQAAR